MSVCVCVCGCVCIVELAWRSCSVTWTAHNGPGFDSLWGRCKTRVYVLRKGQ